MRYLQQNRDKIVALGLEGREKFGEQFLIDRSAKLTQRLYQFVLSDAVHGSESTSDFNRQ
jgi:hypothetical protein